jgi:Spo0E like sporulation regulatory protein
MLIKVNPNHKYFSRQNRSHRNFDYFFCVNLWIKESVRMFKNDHLIERINQLKKELVQIVKETGFNSPDTLCCSQKLDRYIFLYQKELHESSY